MNGHWLSELRSYVENNRIELTELPNFDVEHEKKPAVNPPISQPKPPVLPHAENIQKKSSSRVIGQGRQSCQKCLARNGTARTRSCKEREFFRALKMNIKIKWSLTFCFICLPGLHKQISQYLAVISLHLSI